MSTIDKNTNSATSDKVESEKAGETKPSESDAKKPADSAKKAKSDQTKDASKAATQIAKAVEQEEVKEKPAAEPADPADKKVLILEDTMELAEVIQATLERIGIQTKHETHAAKAIEMFATYKPDLVLLDIGLPDMSGWKFLDGIKELDKENLPHIVIITAYGDPANRLMGKLQDVTNYLIKPFSPDEVERIVQQVLNLKTD